MFFPHNINHQIKMTKKASKKDKTSVIVTVLGFATFFLYMFFRSMLRLPALLAIFISFLITGSALFVILRAFVFKERDLVDEEESSKSDSLERYYKIIESELPVMIDGIEVFENTDGNMCACVEILYGPNDMGKSKKTLKFLGECFNLISRFSIDFKVYVTREDFLRSIECKRFLNTVNSIKDQTLASTVAEMADLILGYTEKHSNLYSTFVIMRFTPVNMPALPGLRSSLLEALSNSNSSIRALEFCDRKRFRNFIRDYNRVDALDLSRFKGGKLTSRLVRKYKRHIFVVQKNDIGYSFNTGVKKL